MPFTLAHPAIVIPLGRSLHKQSLTGLIVGSMVPDVEFFLQMREVENTGHHLFGILIFDLPMGIIMSFLFHNILRNTLISNLPSFYKRRFIDCLHFDWNAYAWNNKLRVLLSILIGVGSHLAWDAFTHQDGFFVQYFPALSSEISVAGYSSSTYFMLQIIFSIMGMIFVHLQVMNMPVALGESSSKVDYRYWISLLMLYFIILSIRIVAWPQFNSFGGIAIAIMGAALYSWLPVTIFFKTKNN